MTPEHKHIAKYLTTFIEENYDKLSDTAKIDEAVSKEILSKEALIELVNTNEDFLGWFFMEGLRHHITIGDCLEELIVDCDYDDTFIVFEVNDKFIKWWPDSTYTDYFQFVEQKTKLVEVTYYE